MSNVRDLYDRIWERKLADPVRPPPPNTRLAVGAAAVERYRGGLLLDVGCGDGTLALLVARGFDAVYGVELSVGAARRAASRGMIVAVADLDRALLPYQDCSVDLVTCLDVIEHVLDPRHLLRQIARVLRPGGHCIVSTPNVRYWRHLRRLALGGRFPRTSSDAEGYDGGHLHYFTFPDIEELLGEAGLQPVARFGTYGSRGRRLPPHLRGCPPLQELLATGLFVVARRDG